MQPDDESFLKPAFAELHRQQREQAPPFGAMREWALRAAAAPRRRAIGWGSPVRVGFAAAAAALVVAGLVWWGTLAPEPRGQPTASSVERVEQLLDAIEHDAAIYSPVYSTDFLLTQNDTP